MKDNMSVYLKDTTNCECGAPLVLDVMKSQAGYYIGKYCSECGPYMRLSGYYRTSDDCLKHEKEEVNNLENLMAISKMKLNNYLDKNK